MAADQAALTPLTVDIRGLGVLLDRSKAALERDLAAGKLIEPIRFGRSRKWLVESVKRWLSAGAPAQEHWRAMEAMNARRLRTG